MENQTLIYTKLEQFIKKFYTNELLRGSIFFVGIGLLYFLFTLFIEYFLWLKPTARTVLFWTFIAVELFLFLRFILFPIFKLFKLQNGIDFNDASKIIGNHFSEVGDKLTNFLQLSIDQNQSELLLASIDQKANLLQPIPFGNAINFRKNQKYLPLAILPILFFLFFYISGNSNLIFQSFNRVVHYKEQFLPPAPFEFQILNSTLQTQQNQDFILKVKTIGKIVPENTVIFIGTESYYMERTNSGEFQFLIAKPKENLEFHLEANVVKSHDYELKVITVPSISNFEMVLNFPSYLNRKSELIKGSGNAVLPEGTKVTWRMNTLATQKVEWIDSKTNIVFSKQDNQFLLSKNINQNIEYQIVTSNNSVQNYEKLDYQISVIKDQFPSISINAIPDSLKTTKSYLLGQITDDYGFSKLQIVYYEKDKPQTAKHGFLPIKVGNYDQFIFSFPGNISVITGLSYDYYFEIFDNDVLHNFKSTKSTVFTTHILTDTEKEAQVLQQQNSNINSLQKSVKLQNKQLSELEKLQQSGKKKESFEFKEQQQINDFLLRQEKQDALMKEFSDKVKDNLDKFKTEKKDSEKELLEKRLETSINDLEKNKKLLDELKELNDKIKHDQLMEKLDNFKQNVKNQTKNLEQLVELTKKYYVEKKAEQLKEQLEQLSEQEEQLSNKEKDNTSLKQDDIKQDFKKIEEELNLLEKENKELKAPIAIPKDEQSQKSIEEDLKKASEDLKNGKKDAAKPKQKAASKKMKQMAMKMGESMQNDEKEQIEEDVAMLRQILDNLLSFSFTQEDLMKNFKSLKRISPSFNKNLKSQQNLKQLFTHIDDSLFAMSLRNPKICENITKEIGNVQYNVDKSIESLADSQISKGVSHQQYTITSSNKLADFLSDALNSMQMSLSMMGKGSGKPRPGKGSGSGMQLPDIIKKQEALGEKIKKASQKGSKKGEGKEGKTGDNGKPNPGSNGSKSGSEGSNSQDADSESESQSIMQIYKEQQSLREALQNELTKQGLNSVGQNTLNQMKNLEKQLLNKGFLNDNLQKVSNIKQELLKLNKAIQEQGEESNRQSNTNTNTYSKNNSTLPPSVQDYFKSIEILNRQSLPLHSNFNKMLKYYFNK